MGKIEGKVAVITGGSSGIGLAIAQRFVAEGAYVYIFGRRQDQLEVAARAIGAGVTPVRGDVLEMADLERLYATVQSGKGSLDIVVTSAGLVEQATLESASEIHFDKTFDLNARGTFFTVQKSLPLLNRGAAIVLLSSGMSYKGFLGHGTYSASKAAVRSFSRTWANELKERAIRVNTLSPGAIDTPIIDAQSESKEQADQLRAMYASITPLGRIGRPEEIAAAALFLASAESSYITGFDLVADGGIVEL